MTLETIGENVARLLGHLNSAKPAPEDANGHDTMDEYGEKMRSLVEAYHEDIRKEGGKDFISDVRAGLLDDLKQEVDELALHGRFLQAAEKIKTMISIQEDLSPRQDNSLDEITILKGRRADLLLQCSTVRCHLEASRILQDLVTKAAPDEEKAILYWKIGRLHAVPELLGDRVNRGFGQKCLNRAVSLLRRQPLFPHDVVCSAMQLIVQVFKDSGDDLMAKATEQEMRKMIMGTSGSIDGQEDSEAPGSAALDWCRGKGYPVRSHIFRYFGPVEDGFVEGSGKGRTPLHTAAREGQDQVVKEMLAEVEGQEAVDVSDSSGSTALMEAAKACDIATVNTLLAYGASVDHADDEGRTALHWAADQHRRTEEGPAVVKALLARGPPGLVDRRGGVRGETALHLACLRYHGATVQCLLAHDADPDRANRQGQSPLLRTIGESDRRAPQHRDPARRIAHILLAAGADPNARDVYDNTALSIACHRGDADAVDLLLGHGPAYPGPRPSSSSFSSSVTSASAPTYTTAAVTTTPARGRKPIDVNQRGKRGETPLIIAVNHLDKTIVKKLRDHGANPAEADLRHRTAWDHAKSKGAPGELLSLLAMQSRPPAPIRERRHSGRLSRWFSKSETI